MRAWIRTAAPAILVLAAPPSNATPPPVAQTHAQCSGPTYASDQLVCATPDLKAADEAMVAALERVKAAALAPAAPLIERQEAWLRRRSLCALRGDHAACLREAYADRTRVLGALGATTSYVGRSWTCPGLGVVRRGDGLWVGYDDTGAVVAIASPPGASSWKPFLTAEPAGAKLKVRLLDGKPLTCRPSR